MRRIFIQLSGLLLCGISFVHGQTFPGFDRIDSVTVADNSINLKYAWAGGINFAQFSEIDLDLNGVKDLFIFDRSGNKITTYLNTGTPNQSSYTFAPQYISAFPLLHDWAILRDYNCDGKEDIFTYSIAGFSVYKNTSSLAGGLSFQLVAYQVNTDRSPNSTHFIGNLYVSSIDVPAIRDLDGDGDLDVLTFENGGGRIEYHKNMSMELYGVCDSIKYYTGSNCWGEMTENALNSNIQLGTTCPPPPVITHDNAAQYSAQHTALHSGSCLDCINTDGDLDQDVLIGDISSPNMAYVRNGGTPAYAIGDLVDQNWPSYDTPVLNDVFNCPFHLDVNNDGLKDVIVCPSVQNASENKHSVWLYRNITANDSVRVTFVEDNFIQKDMIDVGEGCFPAFFDYDGDGDKDLFIGNYGYYTSAGYLSKISLFKNTGTNAAPAFDHITDDFANIHSLNPSIMGLMPTFGDLDGDGDTDMLCGDNLGQLEFFRKDPGPADNFVLAQSNYQGIDIGNYATPQLIDVDRDGLLDLLIGEQSGVLNYYRNTGTASVPAFTLITSTFGSINVCAPGYFTGYSAPAMYNDSGVYVLLVGSERGYVYRFDNIDGNLAGTFTLTDSMYIDHFLGGRLAPAAEDINNDGVIDVTIGNYCGGLGLYYGDMNVSTGNPFGNTNQNVHIYPNPANEEITIDIEDSSPQEFACVVSDISGKLLFTSTINNSNHRINVNALPPGSYFLTLRNSTGYTAVSRFIISR